MSTPPTSFRLPFVLSPDVHPDVQAAIRYAFSGLKDLNDAIAAMVPKLTSKATTITETTGGVSGGGSTSLASIGLVNEQSTGSYVLLPGDFGAIVVLDTTSTFAVTLASFTTPFFAIISNQCSGQAILTPESGTVNDDADWPVPPGGFAIVAFDGINWWAAPVCPQDTPAVPYNFISAYDSATGEFTQSPLIGLDSGASFVCLPGSTIILDSGASIVLDSGASIVLDSGATLVDSAGSRGLPGQLLSSIGDGVLWITSSAAGGPNFADDETPSGTINGVNKIFTLAHSPNPAGSLLLSNNGLVQDAGGNDYTLVGSTVTFVVAPSLGATLLAWYRF